MKFQIENVGKVHCAEIDVKGITVVAGYNNSGKTTILRSVDVLLKTFCNLSGSIREERIKSIVQVILKQEIIFDKKGLDEFPFEFLRHVAKDVQYFMRGHKKECISWNQFWEIYLVNLEMYAQEIDSEEKIEPELFEKIAEEIYAKIEEVYYRSGTNYNKFLAEINLRRVFYRQASNLLNKNASRIKATDHEQIYYIAFQGGKITELSGRDLGRIPLIYIETSNILDGISENRGIQNSASELKSLLRRERSYNRDEITYEQYLETEKNLETLNDIFQEVLHGRLQAESELVQYKEDSMEEPINIANVASGMKIFLILQRLVENGSLTENSWVLIDEPESNLHPEWHLKLAEILILLKIKMNIHILLSSHSPYFIRALEVKMADYEIKDSGSFYLMEEKGNMYITKDVTGCTEEIYRQLYKPLELL